MMSLPNRTSLVLDAVGVEDAAKKLQILWATMPPPSILLVGYGSHQVARHILGPYRAEGGSVVAPHHTTSEAGFFGPSKPAKRAALGEIDRASDGVLYLEDVFEIPARILERLARRRLASRGSPGFPPIIASADIVARAGSPADLADLADRVDGKYPGLFDMVVDVDTGHAIM